MSEKYTFCKISQGSGGSYGKRNTPECVSACAVLVSTGDQPVDFSANVVVLNPVPGAVGIRPITGITLGNATYYSMHAPSGVSINFSNQYIDGLISQAESIGDYVIGGDFNCEPENVVVNLGVLNTSG